MRRKINHPYYYLLSAILFFSLVVLSGCDSEPFRAAQYFIFGENKSADIWDEVGLQEKTRKEIDESVAEAQKEIEAEQQKEAEAALLEGFKEEERLIPDKPIIYEGDIEGVSISLSVDFKTTAVTGSLSLSGDDYVEAGIEGNIDVESFEVAAQFSGIVGSKTHGMTFPFNGMISGAVSEDLNTFRGVLVDDEGEVHKFTASR